VIPATPRRDFLRQTVKTRGGRDRSFRATVKRSNRQKHGRARALSLSVYTTPFVPNGSVVYIGSFGQWELSAVKAIMV
jgi:hypothetical protein